MTLQTDSYPFLRIARNNNVNYGLVLTFADMVKAEAIQRGDLLNIYSVEQRTLAISLPYSVKHSIRDEERRQRARFNP